LAEVFDIIRVDQAAVRRRYKVQSSLPHPNADHLARNAQSARSLRTANQACNIHHFILPRRLR
jgi:hypothetical protein